MKLQYPLTLPPRNSPARLPALLLPVLVLAALVQFALPANQPLTGAGAISPGAIAALPATTGAVTVPQVLAQRGMFSPQASGDQAQAPADPLGGAVLAGTVQQGRIRYALVQLADGRIVRLAPGGRIAGWQLQQLRPDGARMVRGNSAMSIQYGQHAVAATTLSAHSQSEEHP